MTANEIREQQDSLWIVFFKMESLGKNKEKRIVLEKLKRLNKLLKSIESVQ